MSDGPGVGVTVIECTGTMLTDSDLSVYVDCFQMIYFYVIFLLQPFMSPRYPGGPRVPVRMPNEFNGVSSTRFVNVP